MQPGNPIEHSKHVFRAGLLLVTVLVILLLGRSFFVPATWGEYGRYRGANVAEHMSEPLRHLGDDSCEPCHEEQYAAHREGVHHRVRCELCHGTATGHVDFDEGEKIGDMPVRRSRELCETCHARLDARPPGFPQIDPRQHVMENEGEFSPEACFDCHDPHSPY